MLSLDNIVVYYGSACAVNGISADFADGTITTVIGVNGAGKSTVLKAICGLEPLCSGSITFNGEVISGKRTQEIVKAGISMAPEGKRLFPQMTVCENMMMGAFLRTNKEEINADIEKMYEFFPRLKERHTQRASSLSGGEQQMLAVARCMMSKPKVILLDEPSMGLSPIMTERVGEVIRYIVQSTDISVILVEQNANLALSLAKNAYVMENGQIVMAGPVDKIKQSDYVRQAYLGL